jgi:hypothetical protein
MSANHEERWRFRHLADPADVSLTLCGEASFDLSMADRFPVEWGTACPVCAQRALHRPDEQPTKTRRPRVVYHRASEYASFFGPGGFTEPRMRLTDALAIAQAFGAKFSVDDV